VTSEAIVDHDAGYVGFGTHSKLIFKVLIVFAFAHPLSFKFQRGVINHCKVSFRMRNSFSIGSPSCMKDT
jgi:hypothetical protein